MECTIWRLIDVFKFWIKNRGGGSYEEKLGNDGLKDSIKFG